MKDTLLFIIKSIVDDPDKVSVEETEENGFVQFSVTVAKEEMGRIIGKEGKVIRALRNVMKVPAIKQNKKIQISLTEVAQ